MPEKSGTKYKHEKGYYNLRTTQVQISQRICDRANALADLGLRCPNAQADLGSHCPLTESMDADEQRMSRSDCTDAHADLCLPCFPLWHKGLFHKLRIICDQCKLRTV